MKVHRVARMHAKITTNEEHFGGSRWGVYRSKEATMEKLMTMLRLPMHSGWVVQKSPSVIVGAGAYLFSEVREDEDTASIFKVARGLIESKTRWKLLGFVLYSGLTELVRLS